MKNDYIEPQGWAGTPGDWQPAKDGRRILALGGDVTINLWPSEYAHADGSAELQANINAIVYLKEVLKALQPFAQLAVDSLSEEISNDKRVRLTVNAGDLRNALDALQSAVPPAIGGKFATPYVRTGDLNVKP